MRRPSGPRTLFITGTDTGVGKTTLTALLLAHLRRRGKPAFALKPFCSGDRGDAELFHSLQGSELSLDEINPFFFAEPVAPFVAARQCRKLVPLSAVLAHIQNLRSRLPHSSVLLVEGAGGLLVPLGARYTVLDLIRALECEVLVVAANRLGTINHTLLTVEMLRRDGIKAVSSGTHFGWGASERALTTRQAARRVPAKVVLMSRARPDVSALSNAAVLQRFLCGLPVFSVPFLGPEAGSASAVEKNEKKYQKTLARILE